MKNLGVKMNNAGVNATVGGCGRFLTMVALVASCLLTACASLPKPEAAKLSTDAEPLEETPVLQADLEWQPAWQSSGLVWHSRTFPGKKPTLYTAARIDGRDAVRGDSRASASMMRQTLRIEPEKLGHIGFAWKVPQLIPGANMGLREHDDSPVRVMLAFEGDRGRLSMKDAMLSELARTLTGEEMPYATLMYVWCNSRAPGSVVTSPRTDRIRSIVLESGPKRLNQWLDYQRDIQADFELAFGEKPGALIGVAIMSDSDNTRSESRAWYGAVHITPASLAQAQR